VSFASIFNYFIFILKEEKKQKYGKMKKEVSIKELQKMKETGFVTTCKLRN